LTSCYGIAFFATPHQGSTYLSADEYTTSIRRILQLEHEIPSALREQFRPRDKQLWHLSNQFMSLSADMKIWSFLETVDSTMHVIDTNKDTKTQSKMEFHVPITSIRSGLLDIEHEKEVPMATDHAGIAAFHGQESTRDRFLIELGDAVNFAVEISEREDTPLRIEQKVMVDINGFFEDTALGVSDDSPLKLWSTKVTLEEYLSRGPSACLGDRLRRSQFIVDNSSLSSFDSPHSSYISNYFPPVSDPLEHQEPTEQEPHKEEKQTPLRPPMPQRQSFEDTSSRFPQIHITAADMDGQHYLDDRPSESPPTPQEQKRRNSMSKALGLSLLQRSHRQSTSDSSQDSSERPPS
jgi:hypothetical protein